MFLIFVTSAARTVVLTKLWPLSFRPPLFGYWQYKLALDVLQPAPEHVLENIGLRNLVSLPLQKLTNHLCIMCFLAALMHLYLRRTGIVREWVSCACEMFSSELGASHCEFTKRKGSYCARQKLLTRSCNYAGRGKSRASIILLRSFGRRTS
jgi:hypothetical protein